MLVLSGAKLIFNSEATKKSFKLSGKVVYNGVEELNFDFAEQKKYVCKKYVADRED